VCFQEGRELLEDDPCPGRPVCSNHENVKTHILVILDRRITTGLLDAYLGVGKEMARQIFERNLEKRKICLKFVPHSFRPEQREHQAECCYIFMEIVDQDRRVLQRIVTSAESWCFQFNPEMK
jgi:hypothetical protein